MDTERINTIVMALETLKNAKFIENEHHSSLAMNLQCINFITDNSLHTKSSSIKMMPFEDEYLYNLKDELNEAIKPVLKKYEKIYEEELKKLVNN